VTEGGPEETDDEVEVEESDELEGSPEVLPQKGQNLAPDL